MKIMFICTGNICRSAMAHHLLEKKIKDKGIIGIEVYSCGVFAEQGDYADYSAIEAIKEYGVDLKKHKATNIRKSNIQEMDLILCATKSHTYSVLQLYPELKGKVFTMKEYVEYDKQGKDIDIPDPWGFDIAIFRFCVATIDQCLDMLIEKIDKK